MSRRSFDVRKGLAVAICGVTLLLAVGASAEEAPSTAPVATPLACTPPITCCRVCTSGKACGNTCIQESKICHKGRGCACNAAEVCAEDP